MASSLSNVMLDIQRKIEALAARQANLIDALETLKAENADLRAKLRESEEELRKARLDKEFLEVSHFLADSPDALLLARRKIARMIRTIDKCVVMLKDGSV